MPTFPSVPTWSAGDPQASLDQLGQRDQALLETIANQPAWSRPGDAPELYGLGTTSLTTVPANWLFTDTFGHVVRMQGDVTLSPYRRAPIEAGRVYLARFIVQRRTNTTDPANDAVRLGVAYFDASQNFLSEHIFKTISDLTVESGRQAQNFVYAREAGNIVNALAPASARYARPFVRVFGTLPRTDVEVLGTVDITDSDYARIALAEFETRYAAAESVFESRFDALGDDVAQAVSDANDALDTLGAGALIVGNWDASSGSFPTLRPEGTAIQPGDAWIVTTGGTVNGVDFVALDRLVSRGTGGATYAGNWVKANYSAILSDISAARFTTTGATRLWSLADRARIVVNPFDWDGVAADGETDDTAVLLAAIAQAQAQVTEDGFDGIGEHVVIDLQGRRFGITARLQITKSITLRNGRLVALAPFIGANDTTASFMLSVSGFASTRTNIDQLEIDGGIDLSDGTRFANLISVRDSQRCRIANVTGIHPRAFGVQIGKGDIVGALSAQAQRMHNVILREYVPNDVDGGGNQYLADSTNWSAILLSVETADGQYSMVNASGGLGSRVIRSANQFSDCHFTVPFNDDAATGHACMRITSNVPDSSAYAVGNMFSNCYFDNGELRISGDGDSFGQNIVGGLFLRPPGGKSTAGVRFITSEADSALLGYVEATQFRGFGSTPTHVLATSGSGSWAAANNPAQTARIMSVLQGGARPALAMPWAPEVRTDNLPVVTFGGGATGRAHGTRTMHWSLGQDNLQFDFSVALTARGSSTGQAGLALPRVARASTTTIVPVLLQNAVAGVGVALGEVVGGSSVMLLYKLDGSALTHADCTDTTVFKASGRYLV